jgi:hypothetical protein
VEGLNGFVGGFYADIYVVQAVSLDFEIPFVVCQRAPLENVLQARRFAAKRMFSAAALVRRVFFAEFHRAGL